MIQATKIPRGVANIFVIDEKKEVVVNEKYSHRPDLILDSEGNKNLYKEIMNNYMSNTSPISCDKNIVYTETDELFNSYFGVLNG